MAVEGGIIFVSEAGADGSQSTIVAMPGTAVAGTLSLTTPDYDCPDTPCPISASYGTGATADGETVSGVSIYFGAVNYGCALWLNLTTLPAESCNFAQAKG